MPYRPRPQPLQPGRFAPTSPPADPPASVAGPAARPRSPFLSRVSPRKFAVSPDEIFQRLFGRKLEADPLSGVSNAIRPAAPAGPGDLSAVFARLFPNQKI